MLVLLMAAELWGCTDLVRRMHSLSPNRFSSFVGGWGWGSGSTLLGDLRGTVMAHYKILRASWFGICCLLLTVCSSPSTSPSLRFFAFKVGPLLRHFLCLLGLSTAAACLPNTRIVSHASEGWVALTGGEARSRSECEEEGPLFQIQASAYLAAVLPGFWFGLPCVSSFHWRWRF